MLPDSSLARVIHEERAARWQAEASIERILGAPRRSVRQRLGGSIAKIGERIAAETLARFRPAPMSQLGRAAHHPAQTPTPIE